MNKVTLYYFADQIDEEGDKRMDELLATAGWERWASGYDLVKNRRDLCYEKTEDA